jgi:hypothetical protein
MMGTHAFDSRGEGRNVARFAFSLHWLWLAGGLGLAFALPYLLTDVAAVNRDLFYGLYAVMVIGLLAAWSRSTGYDLVAAAKRHWVVQPPPAVSTVAESDGRGIRVYPERCVVNDCRTLRGT